jgi:tetratricopeptide (TPR) repeat protein
MRIALLCAAAALCLSAVLPQPVRAQAVPDNGVFAPVARRFAQDRATLEKLGAAVTRQRIALLMRLGRVDAAYAALPALKGDPRAVALARFRVLLARQDYAQAEPLARGFRAQENPSFEERDAWLAWRFAHDAAGSVDTLTRGALGEPGGRIPELLAAARLAGSLLDYARAESCYARAMEQIAASSVSREYLDAARDTALIGLAQVRIGLRDWDGAVVAATKAIEHGGCVDAMTTLAQALLRVGRTGEAISAAEWATRLGPYSEMAHYMRGNGYTVRRNYTQLFAAYPKAFAETDPAGRAALKRADQRLLAGDRAGARAAYVTLRRAHPTWADVPVRIASLDFEDGRFLEARTLCFQSLALCPEYGRAHAVLAKALQFQRFTVDVHREAYEAAFAAAPMPDLPGIGQFVKNWAALSPRVQKRVALSIEPWRNYLPVLLAGGADFYIKPMYMRLCEVPGQEPLKDTRIDYDSRLWDDVRGCGGYHTVTGIEDVEATVFARYNTVLHELTHQVHAVLPADQARAIRDLYQATKVRDDSTHDAFLSRYSGVAVEEYLAEGANSLHALDRDAWDPRPELRSRLERKDPVLRALIEGLMARTDVGACYPIAFVNAGDDRIGRGLVDEALPWYAKALERQPDEEGALASLVRAYELGNRESAMLLAADQALKLRPESGVVVATAADATWHGGRGLDAALHLAQEARPNVRAQDLRIVDLEIGRLAWMRGDAATALAAYDSVLARQSDSPEGLRGRAAALALAQRWDQAFAVYDQAVRQRTGIVDLRTDYALDLIRANRLDEARAQLAEARLLDPEDARAEALRAFLALRAGAADLAVKHARQALAWGPWSDLAQIALGAGYRGLSDAEHARAAWDPLVELMEKKAPPRWIYRASLAQWIPVRTFPAVERELLRNERGD